MPQAYKITVQPVDGGARSEDRDWLADGNNVPTGHRSKIVKASNAQVKALLDYCGHMNAGTDTAAVETAINAL